MSEIWSIRNVFIFIYLFIYMQLGCHPVAVVILHVNETWNWLLQDLSRDFHGFPTQFKNFSTDPVWSCWFVFPYRFDPSPNCFNIGGEWIACIFTLYMKHMALAAEYCRIIGIKRVGLSYRVCNDPSVTVLDGGNIFLISFTPFYVFVEIRPTFTLFA